jgi:hypothetical protein
MLFSSMVIPIEVNSHSTFSSFSCKQTNTKSCFAVKVISQKSHDLKARIPQWQDDGRKKAGSVNIGSAAI